MNRIAACPARFEPLAAEVERGSEAAREGDLHDRVRALREQNRSPKEIARALGVRPAEISEIVRGIGSERARTSRDSDLVGCWVNSGWSEGLAINGHPEWREGGVGTGHGGGLVGVLVARRERNRMTVCGYLLDVWCLGAKNALGPRQMMSQAELAGFRRKYFSGWDSAVVEIPIELARHLVFGAVDYANSLGFRPHADFKRAARHLGQWDETSAITFGNNGKVVYIQGPYDSPQQVTRVLSRANAQRPA